MTWKRFTQFASVATVVGLVVAMIAWVFPDIFQRRPRLGAIQVIGSLDLLENFSELAADDAPIEIQWIRTIELEKKAPVKIGHYTMEVIEFRNTGQAPFDWANSLHDPVRITLPEKYPTIQLLSRRSRQYPARLASALA